MIFKTERLLARRLQLTDLDAFHEMQSNPNVLRHVPGEPKDRAGNAQELAELIHKYDEPDNDFWIWAIEQKSDNDFVGTCAIVATEEGEMEIGYRFLERFWGRGYGKEIVDGLLEYGVERFGRLVAYVGKENIASVKILDASAMEFVREYYNAAEKCMDRYYQIG